MRETNSFDQEQVENEMTECVEKERKEEAWHGGEVEEKDERQRRKQEQGNDEKRPDDGDERERGTAGKRRQGKA